MKHFILITSLLIGSALAQADPWIDEIASLEIGSPSDPFFAKTSVIFGPPTGNELGISGSLDVLNIGSGGEIVVSFVDNAVFDGPGPDFTIFENPFYRDEVGGSPDPTKAFTEPAYVSVSDTGTTWVTFLTDYSGPYPLMPGQHPNPAWFSGFAGIHPVFSSPDNGIDPLDPQVSGGDAFDLADVAAEAAALNVDLQNIRYIRIRDVVVNVGLDDEGDVIPGAPGAANGFDLDAVGAINSIETPLPATAADSGLWSQYE